MKMSTIQHCTQMRGRHFLALFNAGYFHKNNCTILAQFSTKMPWIRPMPVLKIDRMATSDFGLDGQTNQFGYIKIVRNSSGITSSIPALDVHEKETAKNEEFSIEKEEEGGKIEMEQQQGKQAIGGQKIQKTFGRKIYTGQNGQRDLKVHYEMGKSGRKFIEINMGFGPTTFNFPNILVPEDIFGFVRAMDEVLEAVHDKKSIIIEASNKRQERLVMHTANAKGMFYDYRLELYVFNNNVFVQMDSVANGAKRSGHKPRYLFIPLHQFHWLRHTIGELFAENGEEDVQQQFGKPPGYPAWLNRAGSPHTSSPNNQKQQKQQSIAAQPQMQSQQAMLQQLLQLVLQQQQQLQQMQTANAQRNNNMGMGNAGFGGVVPKGSDQIILMSELLAQQQHKMHNNQLDDGIGNLLAQFQQTIASTTNNNNQLTNLMNLLLQNNSGQKN